MGAIHKQVENGGVKDRFDLLHFPRRRRPRKSKNAGADDGADSQGSETPGPERFAQAMVRFFGGGDQRVDAAGAEEPVETAAAHVSACAGPWPSVSLFSCANRVRRPRGVSLAGPPSFVRRASASCVLRLGGSLCSSCKSQAFLSPAYFSTNFFMP